MTNMESLSPNLFVKDMSETIRFYEKLGFKLVMTVPEQGDYLWAMMTCDEITFMFQTLESLGEEMPEIKRTKGGSLLFYIQVSDIRKLFQRIEKEVMVVKGLEKTFYGATEFSIVDNNGFILTFAEHETSN